MTSAIFKEYGNTDMYQRSLQNIYVNTLCKIVKPEPPAQPANPQMQFTRMRTASVENNDIKSLVTSQLETIKKKLKRGKGDERTLAHYRFLQNTMDY
jgi:hypothetical protein